MGGTAAPVSGGRGSTDRLRFLDAVRGFALILMIANHTGRWWQDGAMGWPRYNMIYATMAVGAPLFLFLVGFCLPLSFAPRRQAGAPVTLGVAMKFLQRGAKLVLAGWALNLVVFRDEPFWEGGVLQTIGLGIIACLPPMLVLHRRAARYLLVAFALGFFALFSIRYEDIVAWLPDHHGAGPDLLLRVRPVALARHRVDRPLPGLGLRAPGHPRAARPLPRAHGGGRRRRPGRVRVLGLGARHAAPSLAGLQARFHREQPLDRARDHELPVSRLGLLPARPRLLRDRGPTPARRVAGDPRGVPR